MAVHTYQNIACIIALPNAAKCIWELVLMLLLLVCSAFFSGAETSFFNLSRRQINSFQKSTHKLQKLAAKLLSKPKQLLSCLLFGNMMVNVLFYAISSTFVVKLEQQMGMGIAAIIACLTFCLLVLFGEILPKSLAYTNSKSFSVTAALPTFLALQTFTPIISVFRLLIIEPFLRLLLGSTKPTGAITTSEFELLIKKIRKRGLITTNENKLLTEIIELGFLKVRDCLQPRVDMVACEIKDSNQAVCKIMRKNHLIKLPVYIGTIDNIVGLVNLRHLLLNPELPLEKVIQKISFVPEQKTIESLIEFFRSNHTDMVIVVDEYGGIAGSIRLEDIAEELLGPIEIAEDIEFVEQIGPFEYRLAGNLSIHDWTEAFSIDLPVTRISTIAGFVTTLLGKIPKSGDMVYFKNLKFTAEKVQKHRIKTIVLTLKPIQTND